MAHKLANPLWPVLSLTVGWNPLGTTVKTFWTNLFALQIDGFASSAADRTNTNPTWNVTWNLNAKWNRSTIAPNAVPSFVTSTAYVDIWTMPNINCDWLLNSWKRICFSLFRTRSKTIAMSFSRCLWQESNTCDSCRAPATVRTLRQNVQEPQQFMVPYAVRLQQGQKISVLFL